MRAQNSVKLQVWLMIILVFALGGVTGAAIDRLFLRPATERFEPGGRGSRGGGMANRMAKDLNLTEEQSKQIHTIFEESRKQFRMEDCPGFVESRQRTRERIRAVLTAEQQVRFDEINAKRDADMNRPKS